MYSGNNFLFLSTDGWVKKFPPGFTDVRKRNLYCCQTLTVDLFVRGAPSLINTLLGVEDWGRIILPPWWNGDLGGCPCPPYQNPPMPFVKKKKILSQYKISKWSGAVLRHITYSGKLSTQFSFLYFCSGILVKTLTLLWHSEGPIMSSFNYLALQKKILSTTEAVLGLKTAQQQLQLVFFNTVQM